MDMETEFVNQFCHRMAAVNHVLAEMRAFYIFEDQRPGTPVDRINQDSIDFASYRRMFTV